VRIETSARALGRLLRVMGSGLALSRSSEAINGAHRHTPGAPSYLPAWKREHIGVNKTLAKSSDSALERRGSNAMTLFWSVCNTLQMSSGYQALSTPVSMGESASAS
jgi:hypothetical protein